MNYPVYGNTVSVVTVKDIMQEVTTIQVVENPTRMVSNIRGEIFLISMGNYGDVPNTLQRIDPRSLDVKVVTDKPVTYMSMGSDIIYEKIINVFEGLYPLVRLSLTILLSSLISVILILLSLSILKYVNGLKYILNFCFLGMLVSISSFNACKPSIINISFSFS